MENKINRQINNMFSTHQLGSIAFCLDPVSHLSDLSEIHNLFAKDPSLQSYPLEKDGGVVGLLSRKTIEDKSKSTWESLKGKSLDHYLNTQAPIVDARENLEKVFTMISSWPEPKDLLVYHRGRYLGVASFTLILQTVAANRNRELERGKQLQQFLIHSWQLDYKLFYHHIYLKMAHALGGDFYQTLDIDPHRSLIALFDVSGKNISASLATSLINGYFATLKIDDRIHSLTDEQILTGLNSLLTTQTPEDLFTAAFFCFINEEESQIKIFNLGYNSVYIFKKNEGKIRYSKQDPQYPPLGIDTLPDLKGKGIKLTEDLKLITFSDGINDLKNPEGEDFGEKRIKDYMLANIKLPGKDFLEKLETTLNDFQKEAPQADDITLLHLHFPS